MSKAQLRASLALWRRRHTYRQKRLDVAHQANDAVRIEKWEKLRKQAGDMVHRREAQLSAKRPLREKAFDIAMSLVGVMEVGGNNRGKKVEEIIHYAKGDVPEPWCVDFTIWCYGHAGSQIVKPGFPRAVRLMHVPGTAVTHKPRRGDLTRYSFDHTEIFSRWLSDGWFEAIGGNTGATGAVSDSKTGGDGVYIKRRHISQVNDFLEVLR